MVGVMKSVSPLSDRTKYLFPELKSQIERKKIDVKIINYINKKIKEHLLDSNLDKNILLDALKEIQTILKKKSVSSRGLNTTVDKIDAHIKSLKPAPFPSKYPTDVLSTLGQFIQPQKALFAELEIYRRLNKGAQVDFLADRINELIQSDPKWVIDNFLESKTPKKILLQVLRKITPSPQDSVALNWASRNGDISLVKFLLSLEDKNKNKRLGSRDIISAFDLACRAEQRGVMKLLLSLKRDGKPIVTPKAINRALKTASSREHLGVIKLLLRGEKGKPVLTSREFNELFESTYSVKVLRLLLEHKDENKKRVVTSETIHLVLNNASIDGCGEVVKLLLESEDENGQRVVTKEVIPDLLTAASNEDQVEVVKFLLEHKDKHGKQVVTSDTINEELINSALERGGQTMKFLLEHTDENGKRVVSPETINEAFDCACVTHKFDEMELLLSAKDEKEAPVVTQEAVHKALRHLSSTRYDYLVKLLLEHKDKQGKRVVSQGEILKALKRASDSGHKEVVKVLSNNKEE